MWEQLVACTTAVGIAGRETAFCIPWPVAWGGPTLAIYWYGILASLGIFAGAWYASKHVEWEGGDEDWIWDMLLWVLIPALLGGRLWYVAQAVIAGSTDYSLSDPIGILNARQGGMNIFGGAVFGLIAMLIYARVRKLDGWLLADAGLMGLLIGQGIGRIGNFINRELYGPPTGSAWFGLPVPDLDERIFPYRNMDTYPPETLFHPTMFYEAAWLFLVFGVLVYLFRRDQERFLRGYLASFYLILAGFGRFWFEFLRPDQPQIPASIFSYSQLAAAVYLVLGVLLLLDRLAIIRIDRLVGLVGIRWARAQTRRQRQQAYQGILAGRRRQAKAKDREKSQAERRKQREAARKAREELMAEESETVEEE